MDVNNQVLNRQRLNNQGLQLGGGTTNPEGTGGETPDPSNPGGGTTEPGGSGETPDPSTPGGTGGETTNPEDPNKTVFNSLLDIYPDNITNQSSIVTGYKKEGTPISFPYKVDKIEPISGSRYTASQLGLTPIEITQEEGETRIVLDSSVTEAWFGRTATMGKSKPSGSSIPENYNENLKTVKFVDGVTKLVDYVFNGCEALQNVEIPRETTTIGIQAFHGCRKLRTIEIPDKVTKIDEWAFRSCSILESIEIPDSVEIINYGAFDYCRKITSLKIPKKVTEIKNWTFARTGLKTIELHENITLIGNYAFFECTSLSSLKIPSSVTYIDSLAFKGCSNLTTINYNSTQADWNSKIKKARDWNQDSNITTIVCTDGTITL